MTPTDPDPTDPDPADDRRRPAQRALRQPQHPAVLRAILGGTALEYHGDVVSLNDRTLVVDVGDPSVALALSLVPSIEIDVDLGGGTLTRTVVPGRRSADISDPHTVELVMLPNT